MPANVGAAPIPFQSLRAPSAFDRLARTWGCKANTAKDRIYGERGIYQMVAEANREFLADELGERVTFLMAPIDASLMGTVPPLPEAQHAHDLRDATEDVKQAEWIYATSTDALEGYVKSLAADIHCAEVLLAALIRERETRKASQ